MLIRLFHCQDVWYTLVDITMIKGQMTSLLNIETSNGLSLELSPVDDMLTVQSKWEQRFIFSVDSEERKFIFTVIYPFVHPVH